MAGAHSNMDAQKRVIAVGALVPAVLLVAAFLALPRTHTEIRPAAARVANMAPIAFQNAGSVQARVLPARRPASAPSAFEQEEAMSYTALMRRWDPLIAAAAKRFDVPAAWIRAVMQIESGGRTMSDENHPITSRAGALGLMQLTPDTYNDMRRDYGLGASPFDPHDNIFAGAAYLSRLRRVYGYPAMFAAYNDGPGHLDQRLARAQLLPLETRDYLATITAKLSGKSGKGANLAKLTRPNGEPVLIDAAAATSVRAALPDEYAPGVLAVVSVGKMQQGVRESVASTKAILRAHGAVV